MSKENETNSNEILDNLSSRKTQKTTSKKRKTEDEVVSVAPNSNDFKIAPKKPNMDVKKSQPKNFHVSSNKPDSDKKKKVLFRVLLISFIALAVAGVAVGMYFLFKTPEPVPENSIPETNIDDFISDINNNNNASPDISEENFVLPSNVILGDIVYIDDTYFVTVKDGINSIYRRTSAEPGWEVISKFSNGATEVNYSKVVNIIPGFAVVSSLDDNHSYLVNLETKYVILDVSGLNSFMFINGFAICYNDNINGSDYYKIRVVELAYSRVVLSFDENDNIYYMRVTDELLYAYSDDFDYVYNMNVVGGKLKLAYSQPYLIGLTAVADDYVANDDEYVIVDGGQKYKLTEFSKVVFVNDYYKLVETRVPTKDYTTANFVDTFIGDDENEISVLYSVSYKVLKNNNEFVKDINAPGVMYMVYGSNQINGYVTLDVDVFNVFDENGKDITYRGKNAPNAVIFDKNFNLLFAYNKRLLGDVIYSFEDYFITSYGSDSAIINKDGSLTGIIDNELYEIKSPNVWNNKFIVKFNSSFGVSDTDGNVVLSPKFSELSPIVSGVTIGYYGGNYYYIDLNTNTLEKLENYDASFHKFTMLGIGMYSLIENGKQNIYLMNGELRYENIQDYSAIIDTNNSEIFKMFVNLGDRIELIKSNIVDQYFYKNSYKTYVASKNENSTDMLSNIESLVFDEFVSFNAPESEVLDEPEIVDPENTELTVGPSSDSSNDEYDAVGTLSTDLSYLNNEYIGASSWLYETYGHSDYWWKKDTFNYHVGKIDSIHETFSYTDEFAKNIVLTPYINSEKLYENKALDYGNGTEYIGTLNYSNEYKALWGDEGIGFGYKTINNERYYEKDSFYNFSTNEYEDGPLAMFGSPSVLKQMIPEYDSNGRIKQWWSAAVGKIDSYVDGVLIYALENEHMVVVITRIHIVTNDLKYPGHGAFKYNYNDYANNNYSNGTSHNASIYTYNVSIGFVDGYSVDELYIGNYLYKMPYDKSSATTYGYDWYDDKQYSFYDPSNVKAGKLAPVAYFVPYIQNSAVQEGILVGADGLGWKKDIDDIANDYLSVTKEVDGTIWHCRNFNEFNPVTTQVQPGSGKELDTMKYWDFKKELYGDANNRIDANPKYIDSTSLVRISIRFSTAKERDNNIGIYADNYKKNIKYGTARTINGLYYIVETKDDGNVIITPKTGFYISDCKIIQYVEKTGDDLNNEVDVTIDSKGVATAKVDKYKKGTTYIHISSISVRPIIYELSNLGYTYYFGEQRSMWLMNVAFTPYVGNYKNEDAYKIEGSPVSTYNGTYNVGSFYYGAVSADAPTISEKATINNLMSKLNASYYGYEFVATIKSKDTSGNGVSIANFYDDNGVVNISKVTDFYFKDEGYKYYTVNFELLNDLFDDVSSTNVTMQTFSLYNVSPFYVIFDDKIYSNSQKDFVDGSFAQGIKVYDGENYQMFTFDDNETMGIGDSFLTYGFIAFPGCEFGEVLNYGAQTYLDTQALDSNSAEYKFWSLLSKTDDFFILFGCGWESTNWLINYYGYNYSTQKYKTDSIYFMYDKLEVPDYGYDSYIYGMYNHMSYSVKFAKGDTDKDCMEYSPTMSYGSDEIFTSTNASNLEIGDQFLLQNPYLVSRKKYVNNFMFSDLQLLEGWVSEGGVMLLVENNNEKCTIGALDSQSQNNLSYLDTNYDGVIELTASWKDASETQFKYTIEFVDPSGMPINLDSELLESLKFKYGDANYESLSKENYSSDSGCYWVNVGVGDELTFSFSTALGYGVLNASIIQETGNIRTVPYPLSNKGDKQSLGYKTLSVNIASNYNVLLNKANPSYTGYKTEYDFTKDGYRTAIERLYESLYKYNNGESVGVNTTILNSRFGLESAGQNHSITIKETEIGTILYNNMYGGKIVITIGDYRYSGNVGVGTIQSFNSNDYQFDVVWSLIEPKKRFFA